MYLVEGPYKHYSTLRSILGSPSFGKLPRGGGAERWHEPGFHEPPKMARTQFAHEPHKPPRHERNSPELSWQGISRALADRLRWRGCFDERLRVGGGLGEPCQTSAGWISYTLPPGTNANPKSQARARNIPKP